MVVCQHGLPNSIVSDQEAVFTSKFWSLPCYFFDIKCRLFTTFYLQLDSQIERQNSVIEAYFRVFINFEQDDEAQSLLMAEFAYNNTKNANIGYMFFKLNYEYHLQISYKEDINSHFKSNTIDELLI